MTTRNLTSFAALIASSIAAIVVSSAVALTTPDRRAASREQGALRTLSPVEEKALLAAREAVWRAFFSGDIGTLERLLPAELVTMNPGGGQWGSLATALAGARALGASGAKLTRLEFGKTVIQAYGDVAIIYTTYLYEIDAAGQRQASEGRATEVFVKRPQGWVNSAWHMDAVR